MVDVKVDPAGTAVPSEQDVQAQTTRSATLGELLQFGSTSDRLSMALAAFLMLSTGLGIPYV